MLTTKDIRKIFLNFFRENGHEVIRSSSLVPRDDPTLLFNNAGMVQFKKIFQGFEKPSCLRAVTSQKCLRVGGKHNDLENVGRTARHHTFFEMLGNFSFGDYFKEKAIELSWKLITEKLGLSKDRLYVTVYLDDDEAAELWRKITGIPAERIFRMGEKDNFWTMGDTGPCGPCSEILYDQGESMTCGPDCGIGKCDCDRFLEIWNLVFMQYNQLEPGKREPLPKPSIDTGMGLERITAICQGVYSNYDIDLFQSIINTASGLAGVKYAFSAPDTNDTDTALRVVADHSRAIAFMIADGIMPSNEGRGYVLRRLIRRAYRFGRLIGMPAAFLHVVSDKVVELMGDDFHELMESRSFINRVVMEEEARFDKTLDKGLSLLQEEMAGLEKKGQKTIPGNTAFTLYDTYGFPLDIINDVAGKNGFCVDEPGFKSCMAEQKARAKAAWKGSGEADITAGFAILLEEGLSSVFVGYDQLSVDSRVTALLDCDGQRVEILSKGQTGYLVAAQTPFYGASGGQAGDTGHLATPAGRALVTDALRPSPVLTVHQIQVEDGDVLLDSEVNLNVDQNKRLASARNHTATHLLHAALQNVLGSHARQAGSLVGPDRLRFDFNHFSAMTDEEIALVEKEVNAAILADTALEVEHCAYDEAIAKGAVALFGEKYADEVRVVSVPGESSELCGGTHLERTGQTGLFLIVSEAGVASGVRRIEALTGWNALAHVNSQRAELSETMALLKARAGETVVKVKGLQDDLRKARKDLERAEAQKASGQGRDLMDNVREVNGIKLLTAASVAPNMKSLREIMDDVRSKLTSGIACLTAEEEGKVSLLLAVSKDLLDRFKAPDLVKEISVKIGGSGGGRPDMAQAGGTDASGVQEAFNLLEAIISK